MKKIDIINQYSNKLGVTKKAATEALDTLIEIITDGIVEEGNVNIHGFGTIKVVDVPERTRVYTLGENKGSSYTTPAHQTIKMKFSKIIKDIVNQRG